MRSIWTGTIGYGPLVLPVKLGTVVTEERTELHQVRRSDGSRINFRRFAAADGKEVPYSEVAKGYIMPDSRVVVLEDADFEEAFGGKSREAKILSFTDAAQVPRSAAASSYYVQPGKGAEKAYALIAEAMKRAGKTAVVSFAMREREALALLYTDGNGYLVLERLHWAAEVKKPDFEAPGTGLLSETDIALTENLVTEMTGTFDWTGKADESEERLARVIQAKAETGQALGIPAAPGSNEAPGDLEAQLKAAVETAKAAKAPARKPRARKAVA